MRKKVSQFEGSTEITHGTTSSGNVMVFFSEIDFHVIEKGWNCKFGETVQKQALNGAALNQVLGWSSRWHSWEWMSQIRSCRGIGIRPRPRLKVIVDGQGRRAGGGWGGQEQQHIHCENQYLWKGVSAPLPITDSNLAGGEENFIPLSRGAGGDFRGDFCCKQGGHKKLNSDAY